MPELKRIFLLFWQIVHTKTYATAFKNEQTTEKQNWLKKNETKILIV